MKRFTNLRNVFQTLCLSVCLMVSGLVAADPISITATAPFPATAGVSQTLTAIYTVTNNTAIELNGIQDQTAQFNGLPSAITIDKTKSTCGATLPLNAGRSCVIYLTLTTPSTATELSGYLYERAVPLLYGAKIAVGPIKVGGSLYTVTPSAGENGSIIPNAPQAVQSGSNLQFKATPNTDYFVDQWLLDGKVAQIGGTLYTLNKITANHIVAVNFLKKSDFLTYTITPTAGANGSITPNVPEDIVKNGELTFTATPSKDYLVDKWLVDGNVMQTGGITYTLGNITANHTVQVTFIPKPADIYTVTPSSGPHGSISPDTPQQVKSGGALIFNAKSDDGYFPSEWLVNGVTVQTAGSQYIMSNITHDQDIKVTFTPITTIPTYTVTPEAEVGGSISPSTKQLVLGGQSLSFTANPSSDYIVYEWIVDDKVVQNGTPSYTLKDIMTPHKVAVKFIQAINLRTITPEPGPNGSTKPYKAYQVIDGGNTTITATPRLGYNVNQWIDNGKVVPNNDNTYTLSNITEDHTVKVTFASMPNYVYIADYTNGVTYCGLTIFGTFKNCNTKDTSATTDVIAGTGDALYVTRNNTVDYATIADVDGSFKINNTYSIGQATLEGITLATFNNVSYAYLTAPNAGLLYRCPLLATGEIDSNSCASTPTKVTWQPMRVAFTTIDANTPSSKTYAYVTDASKGNVFKCSIDTNTGSFTTCQLAMVDQPRWKPYGITFTTINDNQYAYIADNGDGTNPGSIYQCQLDSSGSFNACTKFAAGKLNPWYPISIAFARFNGTKYMYVAQYQQNVDKGSVYQCTFDSQQGLVGVCAIIQGIPSIPRGLTFHTPATDTAK